MKTRPQRKSRSISFKVTANLVLVVTLILTMYTAVTTLLIYKREMMALEKHLQLNIEQLVTALSSALWEYNSIQVEKILQGSMADHHLSGILIRANGNYYVRSRTEDWQPVSLPPEESSLNQISLERAIWYHNEKIGTVKIIATTKFVHQALASYLFGFILSILLLDLFLIFVLYKILAKTVLAPLTVLRNYAISVSSGTENAGSLDKFQFSGEFEDLRSSLEQMLDQLNLRFREVQEESRRVQESQDRFHTLVNTIPDLVWLKNPDGVFLTCNKQFERLYGCPEREIVGRTDYDFVEKELADSFRHHDLRAIEQRAQISIEEWVTFADNGSHCLLETTKAPVFDSQGELIGVLGVARDITRRHQTERERVELQEQLNQMQKIESIGRLAGGVAHDYNNMLGVILGRAQMALKKCAPDGAAHKHLGEIINAAQRSAELTKQLLTFARKQAIEPQTLDLNDTVERMHDMLHRLIGEDIELERYLDEDLWPIRIDSSQLDQILTNLCVNARDAITDNGRICIHTSNKTLDKTYCAAHPQAKAGDFVQLAISDTGCGMDEELQEHIFEPFFTTKKAGVGTGLGLATVYGIVRQNDGLITVYSKPGLGTTFNIFFPRQYGEVEQVSKPTPPLSSLKGTETILLVEDEAVLLDMVRSILEELGYTLLATNSPNEALDIAWRHPDGIDILLTDVIMPEMNGRNLSERLREKNPDLKCLFMSGYTADVVLHHGEINPKSSLLQKPFSTDELAVRVRELLDS